MSSAVHMTCDRALATASGIAPTEAASNHPHLVLATTILASSLAFIDGSVVNVGLPTIGRSFHSTASDLQWVVNAYLLPLSALLLLGGRPAIDSDDAYCLSSALPYSHWPRTAARSPAL